MKTKTEEKIPKKGMKKNCHKWFLFFWRRRKAIEAYIHNKDKEKVPYKSRRKKERKRE